MGNRFNLIVRPAFIPPFPDSINFIRLAIDRTWKPVFWEY